MLDNITRDYEEESARERQLHGLTEASRGSLANLQAAVEMLDDTDWSRPCASVSWAWCATNAAP
jgi:hypothetical protein